MPVKTELSIVIPTLNEEHALPGTLSSLASQRACALEIIVSDGGSLDATGRVIAESALPASFITGKPGRACQLNAGAAVARGEFILFIHADSLFVDEYALRGAIDYLRTAAATGGGKHFAGHFGVRFRRSSTGRSLAYRYYESKARLNRRECAHGDQGILLPTGFFRKSGGFDTSCELLAETRFADQLRTQGAWLLLPQEIATSARRFEKEGLKERQTLNAVIMALAAADRYDLIQRLPELYPEQQKSAQLDLQPLFRLIAESLSVLPREKQADFWERIGGYVCENAWQLAFFVDVATGFLTKKDHVPGRNRFLEMYDRFFSGVVSTKGSGRIAAAASRAWLRQMLRKS
jgi:rSAM/selenodomain-associated transferase 2